MPLTIEAGVTSVEDAVAAERAGANRLELNSALVLGGLTPSWGLLGETIRAVKIPVMVMIRPRTGGFCYSPTEIDVMRRDVVAAITAGAKGVVFGPLTPQGEIDLAATERLVKAAGQAETIFHRAFDLCIDPDRALDQLIAFGLRRIMTSGCATTALQGAPRIKQLHDRAAGRIEILPAGGIRTDNIKELVEETSCTQIHASFRKMARDYTRRPENAPVLGAPAGDETEHESIDQEEVQRMKELTATLN
jgi:copper homeostasis protein